MPKFLFVYHGGSKPSSPDEVADVMAKWGAWFEKLGAAVVDGGNPVGLSKTVFADKITDDGGANPTSGYSLVNANSIDDAVKMAQGCPILQAGGNVEVAEVIDM